MAVLEKIRVKFGIVASIIIAIGLLLFIVDPSSVMTALQNMSSKFDVGQINGKSISYQDFQSEIQDFSLVQEMTTGSSNGGKQEQIRDAVWTSLIYKFLVNENAKNAGLFVEDKEIVDMTSGKTLSPIISGNPAFYDENGKFSVARLSEFIKNMNSDPSGRMKLYWDYLQSSMINMRYFEKYSSLFTASMYENPLMLKRTIAENNTTSTVDYVMVPYGFGTDSSIVVSDAEIKQFYKERKKFFKQQASRDIEYAVFEVKPSEEDIMMTSKSVEKIMPEFLASSNVKNFLTKNSDRPYDNHWYKQGELNKISPDIEKFVWQGNSAMSDMIVSGNTFYVAKVIGTQSMPDSVYVKHILVRADNAEHVADSLAAVVNKGEKFSDLAAKYSADKNSAADGEQGNIGWMSMQYMIPGFESVFSMPLNKASVLKTSYGHHVVLVTKATKPVLKKNVAILVKEAVPGKETYSKIYAKAGDFAGMAAGSYKNYRKACNSLGVYSIPVDRMLESANRLGGIDNSKEITRWAFESKVGAVSDIKTLDNNYFVVAVLKGIHEEGYASLEEVSPTIKNILYSEKLGQKRAAEISEKIKGMTDLQSMAAALNTTVSTGISVNFASVDMQGMDPVLVGAASAYPLNIVSSPVAGNVGTYIFKVTGRDTGSFFTETDAKNKAAQFAGYYLNMLVPVMINDADVKDNRARFY